MSSKGNESREDVTEVTDIIKAKGSDVASNTNIVALQVYISLEIFKDGCCCLLVFVIKRIFCGHFGRYLAQQDVGLVGYILFVPQNNHSPPTEVF